MKQTILGITVDAITKNNLIQKVDQAISNQQKLAIATVNPEFVIQAQQDQAFRDALNHSDIALPEAIGMMWAAATLNYRVRFNWLVMRELEIISVSIALGIGVIVSSKVRYSALPEQIPGSDLSLDLANLANQKGYTIFLLGEKPGIAEQAAEKLKCQFTQLNVTGTFAGDGSPVGDQQTTAQIQQHPADIILVAYGASKQEQWIQRNLPRIPANVAVGVGGTFLFIAGIVPRAPKLVRRFGLEWLFRLIIQPWRWRRQLALPKFIYLVIASRISQSK